MSGLPTQIADLLDEYRTALYDNFSSIETGHGRRQREVDAARTELELAILRFGAEENKALSSKLGEMTKFRDECERQFQAKVAEVGELQSRLRTLAIGIVGARMCLAEGDDGEAYHLLYTAARELSDDAHEPWKGVDALADGAIERRDGQTFVSFTAVERGSTVAPDDGWTQLNFKRSPE